MLQTLLNDKLWLKLKPILLDLNIYDKPNLRNIFTGILYRLKTGRKLTVKRTVHN